MCYNFATFVLYLDVITLIYRENRLTSSETCLSAQSDAIALSFSRLHRFFIVVHDFLLYTILNYFNIIYPFTLYTTDSNLNCFRNHLPKHTPLQYR